MTDSRSEGGHSAENDAPCERCGRFGQHARWCEHRQGHSAEKGAGCYRCAECGRGITTADDLVTVSVDGHAKPAHRTCPIPPGTSVSDE